MDKRVKIKLSFRQGPSLLIRNPYSTHGSINVCFCLLIFSRYLHLLKVLGFLGGGGRSEVLASSLNLLYLDRVSWRLDLPNIQICFLILVWLESFSVELIIISYTWNSLSVTFPVSQLCFWAIAPADPFCRVSPAPIAEWHVLLSLESFLKWYSLTLCS